MAAGKTLLMLYNLAAKTNADLEITDKISASITKSIERAKSGESVRKDELGVICENRPFNQARAVDAVGLLIIKSSWRDVSVPLSGRNRGKDPGGPRRGGCEGDRTG